jgi:hypothetical protein
MTSLHTSLLDLTTIISYQVDSYDTLYRCLLYRAEPTFPHFDTTIVARLSVSRHFASAVLTRRAFRNLMQYATGFLHTLLVSYTSYTEITLCHHRPVTVIYTSHVNIIVDGVIRQLYFI